MLKLLVVEAILIVFVTAYEDYTSEIAFQIGADVDLDSINLDEIDPQQSENAIKNSTFVLYFGRNSSVSMSVPLDGLSQIVRHPKFDNKKPTTLYVHGWTNTQKTPHVKKIVDAYITYGGHNCLVLDWSVPAGGSYLDAYRNARPIGKKIAEVLLDAILRGRFRIEFFFLVGQSLGAQLCGIIAREFKKISPDGIPLRRVSGLDPAGPLFYPDLGMIEPENHLSDDDANFVDIWHSDAGGFGYPIQTGTADFYLNGGCRFQPGCGTDPQSGGSCSHNRAAYYWAEAVVNHRSFYGVAIQEAGGWTNEYQDFKDHKIDMSKIVVLGIDCPETAEGRYYLQTRKEEPFGRGKDGITFDPSLWE